MILSLLNILNSSLLIIPFEFDNLIALDLPHEFSNISTHNLTEMENFLTGSNYYYNGYSLSLSVNIPYHHLSDIVSIIVHPCTHLTSMNASCGHFLNGETINYIGMIYKIVIFWSIAHSLCTLHYHYLITQ